MTDRIEVCPEEELTPGNRKIISKGNVSIGVFNVDGEYYALMNTCKHQYGPVCEGKMIPKLKAEFNDLGGYPDEYLSDDSRVLVCPWHGWTYDVTTGEHTGDRSISIPTYEVSVDDGMVYVETE